MSFVLPQTVDLSSFGWEDCNITLSSLSYKEAVSLQGKYKNVDPENKDAQDEIFAFIESKFVSGTARDEKGDKVDLKKDDLQDLPLEIVLACIQKLAGGAVSPNS